MLKRFYSLFPCHLLTVAVLCAGNWALFAGEATKPSLLQHQYLCQPQGMDLTTLSQCGVTVVSHVPCGMDAEKSKRFIADAHALGIKLLPYVSPEKAWNLDTPDRLNNFVEANPGTSVPYYKAVDPSSHPEWIIIDDQGRPFPRYGSYVKNELGESVLTWTRWGAHGQLVEWPQNRNKFTWLMCSSAEGYIDAVQRGVRAVMDLGFDGVFVDNVYNGRLPLCHGHELGEHRHRNPDENTDRTYQQIVERIHTTVKRYGADKIVLLNSGLEDTFAGCRDAAMIESYICTVHVGTPGKKGRTYDWKAILRCARRYADEAAHGRTITALTYTGESGYPPKDDCFYTYACAQLSGFKWSGSGPRLDAVRTLYRARLIVPTTEMTEENGIWRRSYDRGIVAVNPANENDVVASLPLPAGLANPVDLYSGRLLEIKDGHVQLSVPAESGRVVVAREDAIDNYLIECATTLCDMMRRFDTASAEELNRLPALANGSWPDLVRDGRILAEELLPPALKRRGGADPSQDEAIRDQLAKIGSLLKVVPDGDDKKLVGLRAALQYAAWAADLLARRAASG